MATIAPRAPIETPRSTHFRTDQIFFTRLAIGLSALVVFGFAQFALRGMVDYRNVPVRVHFHGAVMLSWLALFVVQNLLAGRGAIATHRRVGRLGAVLALVVAATASYVGYAGVAAGTHPPFFPPAYFLALTQVTAVFFVLLVGWALLRKRETQWHRRLMFASLILILEPAFGRLLPMPLIMPWGEWLVLLLQLGFFALIARHDGKTLGGIHPATLAGALMVTLQHVAVEGLARVGPLASLADAIGASA